MKRFVVLILAILYLTASSGVAVSVHYCMGQKSGASIALGDDGDHHACKRCGMEKGKKGGCCHDEYKIIKASPDQSLAYKTVVQFSGLIADLPALLYERPASVPATYAVHTVAPIHGPPIPPTLPIYLEIRCLRI